MRGPLQRALGDRLVADQRARTAELALGEFEFRRAWLISASASATAALPASICASSSRSGAHVEEGRRHGLDDGNGGHVLLDPIPASRDSRTSLPVIGADTV